MNKPDGQDRVHQERVDTATLRDGRRADDHGLLGPDQSKSGHRRLYGLPGPFKVSARTFRGIRLEAACNQGTRRRRSRRSRPLHATPLTEGLVRVRWPAGATLWVINLRPERRSRGEQCGYPREICGGVLESQPQSERSRRPCLQPHRGQNRVNQGEQKFVNAAVPSARAKSATMTLEMSLAPEFCFKKLPNCWSAGLAVGWVSGTIVDTTSSMRQRRRCASRRAVTVVSSDEWVVGPGLCGLDWPRSVWLDARNDDARGCPPRGHLVGAGCCGHEDRLPSPQDGLGIGCVQRDDAVDDVQCDGTAARVVHHGA